MEKSLLIDPLHGFEICGSPHIFRKQVGVSKTKLVANKLQCVLNHVIKM